MLIKLYEYLKNLFSILKLKFCLPIAAFAVIGFLTNEPVFSRKTWLVFLSVLFLSSAAAALSNYQDMKSDSKKSISLGIIMFIHAFFVISILGKISLFILGFSALILFNGIYTPLKSKTRLAFIPAATSVMIAPLMGFFAAGGKLSFKILAVIGFFTTLSIAYLFKGK